MNSNSDNQPLPGDEYDAKLAASCVLPEDYSRDHLNNETFGPDADEVDVW